MKYKDYLILPILAMYLVYASCAYVGEADAAGKVPKKLIDPAYISWGKSNEDYGELWYAENPVAKDCFFVSNDQNGKNEISFISTQSGQRNRVQKSDYSIVDKHMYCRSSNQTYDLVFTDALTAYDTLSGVYYRRADLNQLKDSLSSGKFVNSENEKNYFVIQKNGKVTEFLGEREYRGSWRAKTADTITLIGNDSNNQLDFMLIYDEYGYLTAIESQNNIVYNLVR